MVRSFSVSRIRVVMVAMVSHPSPRTMGKTAFPLSPIFLKIWLVMTASLRQVPGILHESEDQKEIAHDGKNDGNRIGQGHGEEAVGTDEKVLKKGDGEETLNQVGQGRKHPFPEDGRFQKIDADLGPEDSDKFIRDEQNEEKDRDSPEGMDRKISDRDGEALEGFPRKSTSRPKGFHRPSGAGPG